MFNTTQSQMVTKRLLSSLMDDSNQKEDLATFTFSLRSKAGVFDLKKKHIINFLFIYT